MVYFSFLCIITSGSPKIIEGLPSPKDMSKSMMGHALDAHSSDSCFGFHDGLNPCTQNEERAISFSMALFQVSLADWTATKSPSL